VATNAQGHRPDNIEGGAGITPSKPTHMKTTFSILLGINAVIALLILVLHQQLP
jgi:hypothetical protein